MPKYTLHYFDIDARAELIRLILAYGDIDHKEILHKSEDWPEVKGNLVKIWILDTQIKTLIYTVTTYEYFIGRYHEILFIHLVT